MRQRSSTVAVLCALLVLSLGSMLSAQGVVINEVQSANAVTIADEDGTFADWIELYNSGSTAVDLLGYGLSDDEASPFKWTFPSVTIQPGAYLLVFASDKDRKTGPYLHTNYKISASGEDIVITRPDGQLVDKMPATEIPQEQSYGRKPDGQSSWFFFQTPTPGAANTTTGYLGALPPPVFSKTRGFYTTTVSVAMSTNTSGATIRYTTDGSDPTSTSPLYSSAISATAGTGGAFKATIIRARCFKTGYLPSPAATHTYFVGTNSSSKYNLPIVSLATDNKNFFDPEIGIYVSGYHDNYNQSGDAWERPLHMEFFEPGGPVGFACDGGVRINGGWTRNIPQKSLRLYADHQNGPGSFNYKVFPDSNYKGYKRLLLRNNGNDNENASGSYTLMRDALMQSLIKGLDVDTQNYRPALVFFNGAYWGIFSLMERQDKYYLADHHPEIDPDQVDLVQQTAWEGLELQEGDLTAYNELRDYLLSHDLTIPANYEYVKSKMDISEVAIHHLSHIYFSNTDWPGNNIRFWRPKTPTGKWRWAINDTDFGFGMATSVDFNTLQFASCRGGGGWPNPDSSTLPLASLLRNREFRDEFINRMADMINTVFVPSTVTAKINSMSSALSPNITDHLARWGSGSNYNVWNSNLQVLRDFANARPAYVRNHFVQFFHLSGTSQVTLSVSPSAGGTVTFSTVSVPAGSYPWTGVYFNDTPIQLKAVPAAGYHFVRWQGGLKSTQNPATITLSGDTAITAVFEVN